MNGPLFLVLIAMLLQNPGAEVFPTPNRGLPAPLPSAFPASQPILPTDPASTRCTTGYGTDPQDGKFCMIIQIAPDAMGAFAKGTMGQELAANVPDEIRNLRIDKVLVRVGSGPVERNLPNPQMLSESRPSGNQPHLNDLVNRTTVPIDSPRSSNVLNASGAGGTGLGNNGGIGGVANNGAYGAQNNNTEVFPNSLSNAANPSNYSDRSRLGNPGNNAGLNGPPGLPVSDNLNSNFGNQSPNSRSNDVVPNNYPSTGPSALSTGDNFMPKTPFYNPIKPNQNNTNSGYATNAYPSTNAFPSTQGNLALQGNLSTQGNLASQGNMASSNNYNRPYTPLANNFNATNGPNGYYDSSTANPGIYAGASPSQAQAQQYGALPTQQPTPYLSSNQYPAGTNNQSLATMTIPGPRQNYPPSTSENAVDEQTLGKDKLLPFLLLFSIVCNVYLGFWMSHLRTRYRQLLSNMRGIPVSDLA